MPKKENPITASIDYLVECGWTTEQARNLISAVNDSSADRLWEIAPRWIEHCGECMKYVNGMLGTVALGLVKVNANDEGEWLFSLNKKGLEVGKQMYPDD